MAHLHDKLQEDAEYIRKREYFNKEDINHFVGKDFINAHILGDMCKSSTKKVAQLAMHEVSVQVLETIKYKTIAEEDIVWVVYVCRG